MTGKENFTKNTAATMFEATMALDKEVWWDILPGGKDRYERIVEALKKVTSAMRLAKIFYSVRGRKKIYVDLTPGGTQNILP